MPVLGTQFLAKTLWQPKCAGWLQGSAFPGAQGHMPLESVGAYNSMFCIAQVPVFDPYFYCEAFPGP